MDAHGATERFVGFFITVDGGYFGKARQRLCSFLISWFEVLAMATPRGVESDTVKCEKWTVKMKEEIGWTIGGLLYNLRFT